MSTVRWHQLTPMILFFFLSLPACTGNEEKRAGGTKPPVPVRLSRAETRSIPLQLEAFGTVEAQASVAVKSRVSGQLQQVLFREGDEVRQEEPLFIIDPQPFALAVQQAEASLTRDQARQANSRQKADRYRQLLNEKFVSQQEFDQMNSDALADESLVRVDQAALAAARLQLDYCRIRAPLSGRTGSLIADPGTLIKADDGDPLVVIHQLQPIEVNFSLAETQLNTVQQAMKGRKVAVTALLDDDSPPETGELAFLDNSVDRGTGTIRLKARFANAGHRLWPGQFVRLALTLGSLEKAVVVPSAAVMSGQQGTYVYTVNADSVAEVHPVQAGVSWNGLSVVEGINAGEQVVIDGQMRLYPGAKVGSSQGEGEKAGPREKHNS